MPWFLPRQEILGHEDRKDGTYFLTKWLGYDDPKDLTWEPLSHFEDKSVILEYLIDANRHNRGNKAAASDGIKVPQGNGQEDYMSADEDEYEDEDEDEDVHEDEDEDEYADDEEDEDEEEDEGVDEDEGDDVDEYDEEEEEYDWNEDDSDDYM